MKLKYWFLPTFLSLMFFQTIFAQRASLEQEEKQFLLGMTFKFDGQDYSYDLTVEDVKDTPSWNPENSKPPLDLNEAVKIAKGSLNGFISVSNQLKIKSINLEEVYTEKWIYIISFDCRKSGCVKNTESSFDIIVKLDGSIVEPKFEKNKRLNINIIVKNTTVISPHKGRGKIG